MSTMVGIDRSPSVISLDGSPRQAGGEINEQTPLIPAHSSLIFTEEQMVKLAAYICDRIKSIDSSREDWLAERDRFEAEDQDDFSHRLNIVTGPDGEAKENIFVASNESLNTTRRQVIPIVATLIKNYIGSDPCFELRPMFVDAPELADVNKVPDPDQVPPAPQVDPNTPPAPPPMPGQPPMSAAGPAGMPGVPPPAPPVKLPTLAERVQYYARFKLNKKGCNMKQSIAAGLNTAANIGEQVIKVNHRERANPYRRIASVLVDVTGNQVFTKDGDAVYQTDAWRQMPDGTQALAKDHQIRRVPPLAPGAVTTSMVKGLIPGAIDPVTMAPGGPPTEGWVDSGVAQAWKKMHAKGRKILYRGPEFGLVNRRDAVIPLDARSIEDADLIAHRFDIEVGDVLSRLVGGISKDDLELPEQMAWFKWVVEKLRRMRSEEDSNPKSDVGKPKVLNNEKAEHRTNTEFNQKVQLAEVYTRLDVDGDGETKEVMLIIDLSNECILWWDYTVNLTPKGVRPFEVIRIYPVPDRWYGQSESKRNAAKQMLIDFCINRLLHQANLNGDIVAYDPEVCEEWSTEEPRPGPIMYRMKGGGNISKERIVNAIMRWPMTDMPEALHEIMQEFMQVAQMESGNMNPGEQNNADLPAAKLATGLRAIARAGQLLDTLRDINAEPGVTAVIFLGVTVLLRHMEPEEEYEFTNGDMTLSDTMTREEVDCLDLNLKLNLTVSRAEEQIKVLDLARQIAVEYYTILPPDVQAKLKPLYVHAFKALDIPDADLMFEPRVIPPGNTIGPGGQLVPVPPVAPGPPPPNIDPKTGQQVTGL